MNKENLISRFMKYVKVDSISGKEGEFAKLLKKDMEDLGLQVIVDDAHIPGKSDTGNLMGYLKGSANLPSLLFCAHMDTVVPGNNIKPILEDGIIRSDGTTILGADDKAGIAAILEAIKYIQENNIPHGDLEVLFTIGEETGMHGSKNLDYSKIKSNMAFVLDSSGDVGGVIVQGPGQKTIQGNFIGKSAHAGLNPEKGISAIQVAARAIDNMKLLRIDEETTANVGIILGGSATNIVADLATVRMECRSLSSPKLEAQAQHMVETMEQAAKNFSTSVEITVEDSYPPFSLSLEEPILQLTEKAMDNIGIKYDPRSTGGGSDTNIFNSNGLKAVTLAIGMDNAHSTEEFITVENLVNTGRLVVSIIEKAE